MHLLSPRPHPHSSRLASCLCCCPTSCTLQRLQVGRRAQAALLVHMTRFTFSPGGALKWKKDVNEYAEALGRFGLPPHMQEGVTLLAALVNVLLVAPESLMGLVNGSLRMPHRYGRRCARAVVNVCALLRCWCAAGRSHSTGRTQCMRLPAAAPLMSVREALRYISLREDFKTARVDGHSLAALFSGEGLEAQLGAGAAVSGSGGLLMSGSRRA